MKLLKHIVLSCSLFLMVVIFVSCVSTKKTKDNTPFKIADAYYQSWSAGVRGGGSGTNVFIKMGANPKGIVLDSIYFLGKRAKLTSQKEAGLYIARFPSKINKKRDIIMSNEPFEEYGENIIDIPEKIPFELKENECVVTYNENQTIKYYKIDEVLKKQTSQYP